jgi:transposase
VEDWAEIRRLHRAEGMGVQTIATELGVARNTVRSALASDTPPRYSRPARASMFEEYEPRVRELLGDLPSMPATVLAQRVGWTGSASHFREKVAAIKAQLAVADPADRFAAMVRRTGGSYVR